MKMFRRSLFLLFAGLLFSATLSYSETELTREAALAAVEKGKAESRAVAAERLGAIGTMDDVKVLQIGRAHV